MASFFRKPGTKATGGLTWFSCGLESKPGLFAVTGRPTCHLEGWGGELELSVLVLLDKNSFVPFLLPTLVHFFD